MSVSIRTTLKSALLAGGVALLLANGATPVFAASPQGTEQAASGQPQRGAKFDPAKLDQRLASLKTELKITEAQTPAWNGVADAMRANVNAWKQAADARKANGKETDSLKRLEAMDAGAKLRAENADRLLAAYRPLYAQMTDEQKQIASQKLMMHDQHHGHPRGAADKKAG